MQKILLLVIGMIFICLMIASLLQLGGLELLVTVASACLFSEAIYAVFVIMDNNKSMDDCLYELWQGCCFHVGGFIATFIVAVMFGCWGKDFNWYHGLGDGFITEEVSPAYLWYVLLVMAAVRVVILQPIYLYFAKERRI